MNRNQKLLSGIILTIAVVLILVSTIPNPRAQNLTPRDFPDFYTKNEDYFITRIGSVPSINRDTYQLEIKGLIDNPTNFSLDELQSLNLINLPLTIECIGNPKNSFLIGTAIWRGFNVFELLETLGISENATGVTYRAADGYYVSHTLGQLRYNGVLGALYMNGVELPPVQGFPLRILNPGYYGAKQPAWVTEIRVIDTPLDDYWDNFGWDTSKRMDVDTKVFFPEDSSSANVSQLMSVGGCAFGGTRIAVVEYSIDDGSTWINATIVQEIDADNVWVFWQIDIRIQTTGEVIMWIRATDVNGNVQDQYDLEALDGTSLWSRLSINVI